jgi:hypothetical protein
MAIKVYTSDITEFDGVVVGTEDLVADRVLTPNYWSKLRTGEKLPLNAYSKSHIKWQLPPANLVTNNWGDYSTSVHLSTSGRGIPSSTTYRDPLRVKVKNAAIIRLNSKLRNSDFSLGVTLIEAHKSASMVANTAVRLVAAYKALKKGRVSETFQILGSSSTRKSRRKLKRRLMYPKSVKDVPANLWLEINYGWRPLVNDVYNAGKALAIIVQDDHRDIVYKAGSQQGDTETYDTSGFRYGTYFPYTESRYENNNVACHYAVTAKVSSTSGRTLSALGLDNPLLVIWDAIPLSFVADWFIPIAGYLEGLATPSGFSFTEGTLSTKTVRYSSSEATGAIAAWGWNAGTYFETKAFQVLEEETFQRSVISGFPQAKLILPDAKELYDAVGIRNMLTSIALLDVFKR